MWNMNLVQQNSFSASKYMCMYLQTYIWLMHSNPSSLKAGRIVFSDFWLIGVELVMGRVQVVYQKSRAFLPWFSGFWVPEPIWNGVGQVIWL